MRTTEKAQEVLNQLLDAFETGNVSKALARTVIPSPDVPSSRWSLNNRLFVFLAGTWDARGIRQWKEVGRWPKKGCRAVYILAPMTGKRMTTTKSVEDETGNEREEMFITGFRAVPVFRVEDTEGKPLDYPETEPTQPPPLMDVAEKWDVDVRYAPQISNYYGYYTPGRDKKEIVLCSHDEDVFFHELAHAAHERIHGRLKGGQHWTQEIVAELSAATLMHLYGRCPQDGRAYQYIRTYAKRAGKNAHQACLKVVQEVNQVLNLIITSNQEGGAVSGGGAEVKFVNVLSDSGKTIPVVG